MSWERYIADLEDEADQIMLHDSVKDLLRWAETYFYDAIPKDELIQRLRAVLA